jgi:4-aminobutyrate aminotransferase
MCGLEFQSPTDIISALTRKSDKPIPENIHGRVQAKCYEKGVMLLTTSIYPVRFLSSTFRLRPGSQPSIRSCVRLLCLTKGVRAILQVIRFIPALIVTEEEMDRAIKAVVESVEEVALEG